MRIAQLSSNIERVPPVGYGGTELVVSLLTEDLVARGHEVTLFSVGNSETASRLISITEEPLLGRRFFAGQQVVCLIK